MNETEKQISVLHELQCKYVENGFYGDIELAEKALREKQKREKGCGWCNKYRMEFNAIDDDGNTVAVDHMVLGDICDFCPVCGRNLRKDENDG